MSYPGNPVEECCDPEKKSKLLEPRTGALEEEQSNKHSQIVFIDYSLFLIG